MTSEKTKTFNTIAEDEIDLIALAKIFWSGRRTVWVSIFIFGILGFFIAIFTSKEFVASTVMVPSGNDASSKLGNLSGLGGLAAMAGININSVSGNDLSPVIYPQIVSSLPFKLELLNTKLNFNESKTSITLYEYYNQSHEPNPLIKYTLGLPGLIIKAIKGKDSVKTVNTTKNQPLELTIKQQKVLLILSRLITLDVNVKEGYLSLSARMPEALAAAQLGQQAQILLQQYIIEFKIKKAKVNLDFIQQRYNETAQKFDVAQKNLASFRDRNKNVTLPSAKTEEERLLSQYNLVYGIYSELAKQLEQAKIQVKQDTPVFTIIEPISVPTKRVKPNRPMILFLWTFFGGVIGTVIVFGKGYLKSIKKQWNEI